MLFLCEPHRAKKVDLFMRISTSKTIHVDTLGGKSLVCSQIEQAWYLVGWQNPIRILHILEHGILM